jgi:hypothetical protein
LRQPGVGKRKRDKASNWCLGCGLSRQAEKALRTLPPSWHRLSPRDMPANSTVTCLYSAEVAGGAIGAPHLLQNREPGGSSVPHAVQIEPAAVKSTATIPARVHASIVSPLVNNVRHIAVPYPTRSFQTLIYQLVRYRSGHRGLQPSIPRHVPTTSGAL